MRGLGVDVAGNIETGFLFAFRLLPSSECKFAFELYRLEVVAVMMMEMFTFAHVCAGKLVKFLPGN